MAERFWAKVDIRGPDECWPWLGCTNPAGYGNIGSGGKFGKIVLSHRYSYELNVGPIPKGKCILHSCDNPPCCNPAHLRPGTRLENTRDMIDRGRVNHVTPHKGNIHYNSKLDENKVRFIRWMVKTNAYTRKELAAMFGVSHSNVVDVCSGKSWKHVNPRILRTIPEKE